MKPLEQCDSSLKFSNRSVISQSSDCYSYRAALQISNLLHATTPRPRYNFRQNVLYYAVTTFKFSCDWRTLKHKPRDFATLWDYTITLYIVLKRPHCHGFAKSTYFKPDNESALWCRQVVPHIYIIYSINRHNYQNTSEQHLLIHGVGVTAIMPGWSTYQTLRQFGDQHDVVESLYTYIMSPRLILGANLKRAMCPMKYAHGSAVLHNNDVIKSAMASQITSLTIVYSTVSSGADQGKHQSSASLAFVWGIHRWPFVLETAYPTLQ